ncbi:MAG TPA: HlyD family efflux transporter periplasmic adaptor subunit [Planctomycetes bacterium]|nr:HlyD family efflux transporter periplasmic adaptor subunit [Planctomycetota bacterium]
MIKFIVAGLILLTTGGWAFLHWGGSSASTRSIDDEAGLWEVRKGDLNITLTENGTLLAKDSAKVNYKGRWQGKITSLIEEGKRVKEGDILCEMDKKQILERKEQLETEITQAEAQVKTAETELEIQVGDNKANMEKAKIALEKAKLELERYRDGEAPKEKRRLRIAIKNAETTYTRAKKKFEDSKALFAQKFIKKTELEDDRIAFERAEVELEGSKLDLEMNDTYTLPMTLRDKQTAVSDAERNLSTVEKRSANLVRNKEVNLNRAKKHLKRLRKNLKEVKEGIEKMTLTAPVPGIVLYGDPKNPWTRENIKVGGEVWGGNAIFTIPDLRVMQVKLQIHEADINKVKVGQSVRVTMDSYPGLVLEGSVTKIATIANASRRGTGSSAAVKKFDVLVTLDGSGGQELKPGVSAKAVIHVADLADTLYVPIQAVFFEEGKPFCHVALGNGEHEKRAVKVGLSNDNFIVIEEGLQPGDRVLLYNPEIGKETQAIPEDGQGSGPENAPADASPAPTKAKNP